MIFKKRTKEQIVIDEPDIPSSNDDLKSIKKQYTETIKDLHESEMALRSFINVLPEPTFLIDTDCRLLICNSALAYRLGKTIDELIGKNPFELLPGGISEAREKQAKLAIASGKHITFEDSNDGHYYQNSIYPINDFKGRVTKAAIFAFDITTQKIAEEKLKRSEEKYRTLIERIPDGIYRSNQKGEFLEMNPAMVEMLGYDSKEELINVNIREDIYVDKESRENIFNYTQRNNSGKKGILRTLKLYKKDGSVIFTEDHEHFVYAGDGKFLYREGILRDITDKYKAEENLRENEERYRLLFDILPVGIGIVSPEGDVMSANDQALKIFGYKKNDMNNLRINDLFNDAGIFENILHSVKEDKLVKNIEAPGKRLDGSKVFVSANITSMKYVGKECYLVAFDDITKRKANEENLLKLSKAVQQSPASIIITDPSGKIEYVNKKFTEISGYNYDEVIGKTPSIFSSGYHSKEFYKNLWDTIKAGDEFHGELLNRKKSGDLYWEAVSISAIKNGHDNIKYFLAVREDITERKLFEKELKVAKENAEKADKLKSEFLAQMSHEIRTPINIILNYTELLKEETEGLVDGETSAFFDRIGRASTRIIRTVDLILEMSTLHIGAYNLRPSMFDLYTEVLENLYLDYKYAASDKNLEFKLSSNTANTIIEGDEFSVRQIFSNLIDNAIKYTKHGKVEISVFEKDNNDLQISIKDSGIGISDEYVPFLFSLFSQEEQGYSRGYEGNGLGLAVVKKYCDLNNAVINMKSEKGSGTEFIVNFLR